MSEGLGLAGKTAIVTGGASNLGRAIAFELVREGARVVIVDVDRDQAARTAAEAGTLGGEVHVIGADLTDSARVRTAFSEIAERFETVDVLVNNVGWHHPAWFSDLSDQVIDRTVDLNLMTTIYCTRAVIPLMRANGGGSVVSMASDAAFGEMRASVYGAAKAGVIALSKGLAREFGRDNIRFNVVAAGLVLPPSGAAVGESSLWAGGAAEVMTEAARSDLLKGAPLKRHSTPEDVAAAVLVFASERLSRQLTGQVLSVSGGRHMPC